MRGTSPKISLALCVLLAAATAFGAAKKKASPDAGTPDTSPPPVVEAPPLAPPPAAEPVPPPPAPVATVETSSAPAETAQTSRVQVWAMLGPKIVLQGGTALPVFGAGPEIALVDASALQVALFVPINFWFVSESAGVVGTGNTSVSVYGFELVPQIRANVKLGELVSLAIDFGGGPVFVDAVTSGTFIGSSSQTQGAGLVRFSAALEVHASPTFSLFLQPFGLDIYFGNTLKSQSLQMYSLLVGAGYHF